MQFPEYQVVIKLDQFLNQNLSGICFEDYAVEINGNEVDLEQVNGNISNQLQITSAAGLHIGDSRCTNITLLGKSGYCDGTAFSPENGTTIEIAGKTMQYYFANESSTAKGRLFSQSLYGWQTTLLFVITFCFLGLGFNIHAFNMVYKIRMIKDLKKNG